MNELEGKSYKQDCLLGAFGALLMLVGDLCLSVVPASPGDNGLFTREAYLSGSFAAWRLPLLLATGLAGMSLGFFTVRAFYTQIRPQFSKTRRAILAGGTVYIASAGVVHFFIGSLADWTNRLAPLLGRNETAALIQAQYSRLMPVMLIAYAGMLLLMLVSAFAVLTKKTLLPRWMAAFHLLVLQLPLVLIPDIRQSAGAEVSTWDFVLSQGSGNAALCVWMLVNALWAAAQKKKEAKKLV